MALYYPFPDDLIGFLSSYIPANVVYSASLRCFVVKPLTEIFVFDLELSNAPYIAEEGEEEIHSRNGMEKFDLLCTAWDTFWMNPIKVHELQDAITAFNKRDKEVLEPKFINIPSHLR